MEIGSQTKKGERHFSLGRFRAVQIQASDVREPFRIVTKEPTYDIENYLPNLAAFTQDQRGPVLQRIGAPWGYKYRFRRALLQPFVIMQGLEGGLINQEQLDNLI